MTFLITVSPQGHATPLFAAEGKHFELFSFTELSATEGP
jgi:hypothetical protein